MKNRRGVVATIPLKFRRRYHACLLAEQILGKHWFERFFGAARMKLQRQIESSLKNQTLDLRPIAVERVADISAETFIRDYLHRDSAVIFTAKAKAWACCQKWSLDYFSNLAGKEDVLLVGAPGLTQPVHQSEVDVETLELQKLIANIKAGGEKYLRFSPLVEKNKNLSADIDLSWLNAMKGARTFAQTFYLFIGGQGRKTLLHSDLPCNLFVQVTGKKKWVLYDVGQTPLVYPVLTNTAYLNSEISSGANEHHPLFQYARPFVAELEPGDILYVPPYMWHEVENLSESIAVGFRFTSLKLAWSASKAFLFLRLLATNPSIWKTGALGRIDTNLIWVHAAGRLKNKNGWKLTKSKET